MAMRIYPSTEHIVSDVPVFVPGSGVMPDGSLQPRGLARIESVERAIDDGVQIPVLFLSGGKGTKDLLSEATAMENHIQRRVHKNFLPKSIKKEELSINTMQNLINSRDQITELGHDELALVTDKGHMPRLLMLAKKILPVKIKFLPVESSYKSSVYENSREILARSVTCAVLFGLKDGIGNNAVQQRQEHYVNIKNKIRPTN